MEKLKGDLQSDGLGNRGGGVGGGLGVGTSPPHVGFSSPRTAGKRAVLATAEGGGKLFLPGYVPVYAGRPALNETQQKNIRGRLCRKPERGGNNPTLEAL